MAVTFAKEGANVVAADMMPLTYEQENVEYFKTDITKPEECEALFKHTVEKFGKIDVLVNNAGITRDALTRKMTDEMWDLVIDVNLKGAFNLTKLVGPHMQANKNGSIINISSVVGVYGNIGQANYAATKAGIIGLTKTWAKEFSMKGGNVRVNAIAPGYTMTDILKTVPQDLLDKFAKMTMLGRLGQPEEIAEPTLFLASDEARYITGHVLKVDGGMRL
jgi:3-oxoacyl-[acyl-carrier protein] reductase